MVCNATRKNKTMRRSRYGSLIGVGSKLGWIHAALFAKTIEYNDRDVLANHSHQ